MTRRSIPRRAIEVALACAILAVPCSSAVAADPQSEDEVHVRRTSREILLREDFAPPEKNEWLSPNFHLHKKSGFGYSRKLKLGDKPLVLRLRGPVMRKQKALGLRFNLNF